MLATRRKIYEENRNDIHCKMTKILHILGLLFLIALYFVAPVNMDNLFMQGIIVLSFFLLFLFFFKKEKNVNLKGMYMKHSTLIIIGYIIVHFQVYIDYILNNIDSSNFRLWVNHTIVVKSMVLSSIGLVSFCLGYLLHKDNVYGRNHKEEIVKEKIYSVRLLTYIAAVLLVLYFYYANPQYLAGYYGIESLGIGAGYIAMFFRVIIIAILIQNNRNIIIERKNVTNIIVYLKLQGWAFNIIIAIYLLSVILSGDRNPIYEISIAYFSGYLFVSKVRIKLSSFITLLILGVIVLSILGEARTLDRKDSLSIRLKTSLKSESYYSYNSIIPQTRELASSIRALHATVDYVPEKHSFLYGRFQLQQLLSVIPFISIFYSSIFDDISFKYGGSANFITWIDQGEHIYSGEGSSVIADFYFDFGLLGVIIGMLCFGYLMRSAELSMYNKKLPTLFANAFFVWYLNVSIYISRSSFCTELKFVFWLYLILIFNNYIINRKINYHV